MAWPAFWHSVAAFWLGGRVTGVFGERYSILAFGALLPLLRAVGTPDGYPRARLLWKALGWLVLTWALEAWALGASRQEWDLLERGAIVVAALFVGTWGAERLLGCRAKAVRWLQRLAPGSVFVQRLR